MTTNIDAFAEECLTVLQEECAEVVQIISKIRRFGAESWRPDDEKKFTNVELLEFEIGDVLTMIDFLLEEGFIREHSIQNAKLKKRIKFAKYRKFEPTRKRINEL